jgi:hypothetical protein
MSPRVTMFADCLLARDRSEDANLGRCEGVGEIVLERSHLSDLRAGCELQLVARHARPDDLADQVCVDAEVGQPLEQRLARALDRLRGVPRDLLRTA